jgi:hypothetical protein
MKFLPPDTGSFSDIKQLKSALKGLSRCVCVSTRTTRTKSPFYNMKDEDDSSEDEWLLGTQLPGLNNLPEVRLCHQGPE